MWSHDGSHVPYHHYAGNCSDYARSDEAMTSLNDVNAVNVIADALHVHAHVPVRVRVPVLVSADDVAPDAADAFELNLWIMTMVRLDYAVDDDDSLSWMMRNCYYWK